MIIEISGQYGDPQADKIYWPLQKSYNDCFKQTVNDEYFKTIKTLSIILRVSGKIQDFNSKGAERLKYLINDSVLTIDLVIPMSSWRGKNLLNIKSNLSEGINLCLKELVIKAQNLGEIEEVKHIEKDIQMGNKLFLESNTEN